MSELEQWFAQKQISSDIFYIDTTLPAPIYLAPLQSPIQFTDFFPEKLKIFEETCKRKLREIKVNYTVPARMLMYS